MPDGSPLLYNPGVRTEYDRVKAFADLTCPFCGKVEPNAMLLAQNHWLHRPDDTAEYDWCRSHGMCIGQHLITNHISYYAKALKTRDPMASGGKGRKFNEQLVREHLAESMAHGAAHGIDGAKIVAFFTAATCVQCERGDHTDCQEDTVWSTVADDTVDCACWTKNHKP